MQLIIQPEAGIAPVVRAIRKAKTSLSICIFRIDRGEIEQALAAAVQRGVAVTALIAHTNRGGDNALRKLELRRMLPQPLSRRVNQRRHRTAFVKNLLPGQNRWSSEPPMAWEEWP